METMNIFVTEKWYKNLDFISEICCFDIRITDNRSESFLEKGQIFQKKQKNFSFLPNFSKHWRCINSVKLQFFKIKISERKINFRNFIVISNF